MIIISHILIAADIIDIKKASAAEKIEVCCFWNENLDDGILTYVVDSDNKRFNQLIDTALYVWQTKMKNIISFTKINEIDSADIIFSSEKSKKKMIEMKKDALDENNIDESIYDEFAPIANTIITLIDYGINSYIQYVDITIWETTFTPELMTNYGFGEYTAYNRILHEIGHVFGLEHSDKYNDSLMSPTIELIGEDDVPLKVSDCDAHTALDQNGMLYYYTEEEFPTYSIFNGKHGLDDETSGYYECITPKVVPKVIQYR